MRRHAYVIRVLVCADARHHEPHVDVCHLSTEFLRVHEFGRQLKWVSNAGAVLMCRMIAAQQCASQCCAQAHGRLAFVPCSTCHRMTWPSSEPETSVRPSCDHCSPVTALLQGTKRRHRCSGCLLKPAPDRASCSRCASACHHACHNVPMPLKGLCRAPGLEIPQDNSAILAASCNGKKA